MISAYLLYYTVKKGRLMLRGYLGDTLSFSEYDSIEKLAYPGNVISTVFLV